MRGISRALLMSASMLEKEGRAVPAALAYGVALANAPPDDRLDAPTLKAVQRGRVVHGAYTRQLNEHIRARVADAEGQCTSVERRRINAFIDMTLRTRRRYRQEPSEYYYPGLPAIEFYERSEFPWLEELEGATAAIGQELVDIIRDDQPGFAPYIHYEQHMPLDQWRELNHSPRWSAYHFYEKGRPIEDRCRRAPATIAAVSRLPQARSRVALALRDVLGARAEDADSSAYRRRKLQARGPPAAHRAAGLRLPRRRRAVGVARRRGLRLRRHDRARGVEQQRGSALHPHLRRVESPSVARGARGDCRHHRRHRRLQRHDSVGARLIGPDEPHAVFLKIKQLLAPAEIARLTELAAELQFVEGRVSNPANVTKDNLQADPRDAKYTESVQVLQAALVRSREFLDFAMPKRIAPPLLCRYEPGMKYGAHADAAIIQLAGTRLRSDLSCTIFVADPASYEGGELAIVAGNQTVAFKGAAGEAIVYPSTLLHEVRPVLSGQRLVAITFVESLIADQHQRMQVYELNEIAALEGQTMRWENRVRLDVVRQNLMRMWSTT